MGRGQGEKLRREFENELARIVNQTILELILAVIFFVVLLSGCTFIVIKVIEAVIR